jgi:outer membrane protein
MKKNLFAILIINFVFLTNLTAANVIDWPKALALAKNNNPELLIAKEKITEAVAQRTIKDSSRYPDLSLSASLQESASAVPGSNDPGLFDQDNITNRQSLSLSGQQLIYDGNKHKYNVAAANEELSAQKFDHLVIEANLRLNLRNSFCDLLQGQELARLTKEIADRRKQQLELVQLRYEAGLEHKGSLLTAEANLAKAELDHVQAKRSIKIGQKNFAQLLGTALNEPLRVTDNFNIATILEESNNFAGLVSKNPYLKEIETRLEKAKYNKELASAGYLPDIYANASLGNSRTHLDSSTAHANNWSLGVNVSYPLLDGAAQEAEVAGARSAYRQSQLSVRTGQENILLTLEESWLTLLNSSDNIIVQEKYLEATKTRSIIAQSQYSTGLISFDNWTIIEDDLVSAQKNNLNAKVAALKAEAAWIQAKGGSLNEI